MIVFSSLQIRRGVRVLLDNATATINPGQKVGLVGKNGCGKSTLLALLKNEISADGGSFTFPGSWQLAWVNQETPALPQPALEYVIDGDREYRQLEAQLNDANERNDGHAIATVHGKLDAIDAWTVRSRAASLLHGLGFSNEQLERPVSDFSGGWRMRLNLAQALICRSDLLLLDEPTNHLDLDAVIWLEKWLKSYQGTLILISHDRDFLDPVVDKIIHIEQQTMFEYTGNYSSFEVQRATRLAQQQAMYESQQERVAHLQSYIDRFRAKATKAKQAQSRIKMLERMELIAPAHVDNPFRFSFRAPESLPNPLLKMEKVSAGYGERIILDSIKLNLVPGSRIGLLGRNGAGKSTLIKLLAGELNPVSGEIGLAKGIKLGYFAQHQLEFLRADESPLQHLARLAPQELEQKLRDYLGGFGFQGDKVTEETRRFSGGEKARLVLALIVWQRPNLLLLDEPTNHLDLDAVIWLEKWLKGYTGTLILISHDRDFLDPIVDKIIHIEQQTMFEYTGNYSSFEVQRATRLAQQQAMYESQQQRVAHLQSYIDRFRAKATKAKQAQSRIKMLERMELIAPAHVDNPFHFSFRQPESLPNPLLKMEKVSAGYGERIILDSIKLNLVPGSRIGLLGRNGAGKSTLIKLLAGELQPVSGEIGLAKGIKLGYFAQHQLEFLRADESPLQHLARLAPQELEQKLRDYLGGFGFQGDKVSEETRRFSGGEKARLVLALIVWQRPNLLLLDEPTNHLDLDMRQALTEALIDFEGALVVVSHDRHLIRSTTDDLYLVHDGKVEPFDGDLEDYQQWLSDSQKQESQSGEAPKESGNSAQARKDQKRREAELRSQTQPLRKEIARLEKEMDKLNAQLAGAEEKLGDSELYDASRKAELTECLQQQASAKSGLEECEMAWLEAQEQLERMLQEG